MKVLVIGGGIGGLATALCLHAVGIDCQVLEQSRQIRELGVGVNLLPHATRELAALGQEIWREPRGLAAGYDARINLLGMLARALQGRSSSSAAWPALRAGTCRGRGR
jgi:5-methylphenazine-1-carboxylate 1-monooxygenase